MTNMYTFPDGYSIPIEHYNYIENSVRHQIANDLVQQATNAMISDEYNFNDTAVRSKTYYHAAQIVRGNND